MRERMNGIPWHLVVFVSTLALLAVALVLNAVQEGGSESPSGKAVPTKPPCDVQLVMHDLSVLHNGYHLALQGRHVAAFNVVAENYAALDDHECEGR